MVFKGSPNFHRLNFLHECTFTFTKLLFVARNNLVITSFSRLLVTTIIPWWHNFSIFQKEKKVNYFFFKYIKMNIQ